MSLLPQLLINALITGSIYALAAAGLTLTYVAFRVLNFGHGVLVMSGAYLFYALSIQGGISSIPLLTLALLLGAFIVSFFVDKFFISPFSKLHPVLPFISTLALAILVESSISMIFGVNVLSLTTGMSDLLELPFDLSLTTTQGIFTGCSVLLLVSLSLYLVYSDFGKQLQALSESPTYLASIGVSVRSRRMVAFFIAVVLAFLSGIFLGFETNLQPLMGSTIMIKAFAAMVLGGMTSLGGAVLGAYLLSTVESLAIGLDFGAFSIPASYRDSISLLFVLFVLLVKPEGIFVKKKRVS